MSEIMAALKNMAIKEGAKAEVKAAPTFYKTFVNVVKKYGRLSESMLMMQYFIKRLAIKETLQYAPLGLMFYKKGKLPIKPEKIAQRDHIKSMVKNISLIEKGK